MSFVPTNPAPMTSIVDNRGENTLLRAIDKITVAGRELWVPAANAHGGVGRCAFVEVQDPWHCMGEIREAMNG